MSTSRNALVAIVAAIAVSASGGYLLGRRAAPLAAGSTAASASASSAGQSPASGAATNAASGERRVLYYRHPMGLDDTSPLPKKDSMGMDYIAVYADDAPAAAGSVTLTPEKVQLLGVRTERAQRRQLAQSLVASGTVALAESRQRAVAPRFEGWVEQLQVGATGTPVRAGALLATLYSPELRATEEEYLVASASPAMQPLAQAALERLRLAGVPADAIARLQQTRQATRTLPLLAPISGVVLDKPAIAGMKFNAGDTLFRLADLSVVWVVAEVPEQDLPSLRVGQSAAFESAAHPGERFSGQVAFIAPTLNEATRTVQARVELPNRNGALKPGMFGQLLLTGSAGDNDGARLSVSAAAVLDSGRRQVVLLSRPGGRFEPREVQLGRRGGEFVEVLSGLNEGDTVASSANFLIDAESNLRGALSGMQGH